MGEVDYIEIVYRSEGPSFSKHGPYNIWQIHGYTRNGPRHVWVLDPTNNLLFVNIDDKIVPTMSEIYLPGKIEETTSEASGPFSEEQLMQISAFANFQYEANLSSPKYLIVWLNEDNPPGTRWGYSEHNGSIIKAPFAVPVNLLEEQGWTQ